jgi:hypothetical protein
LSSSIFVHSAIPDAEPMYMAKKFFIELLQAKENIFSICRAHHSSLRCALARLAAHESQAGHRPLLAGDFRACASSATIFPLRRMAP